VAIIFRVFGTAWRSSTNARETFMILQELDGLARRELQGLELGRKGRAERAVSLLDALAVDPTRSIRAAARSAAEEELFIGSSEMGPSP